MGVFMSNARKQLDFLNGVPEMLILRLLSRRSMHGYQIVRAIADASGGALAFGEGCVYPILHRLADEGFLARSEENVQGRSRVVYRATAAGKRRLSQTSEHWERLAAAVRLVLEGDGREPAVA